MINSKCWWEETQAQSTCRAADVVKTKPREFFLSNTHEYPLRLSSLLPLHVISLLFLKWTLKPKRDMRLIQTSKGRSCGCYGSVQFELLKLGAYLYFKTNRYHVNNSRCCKEGQSLLLASLCGIRSNRGFLWWKSTEQLQLEKTELIVLWWRLGANSSVMSVGWRHAHGQYFQHGFSYGAQSFLPNQRKLIRCKDYIYPFLKSTEDASYSQV